MKATTKNIFFSDSRHLIIHTHTQREDNAWETVGPSNDCRNWKRLRERLQKINMIFDATKIKCNYICNQDSKTGLFHASSLGKLERHNFSNFPTRESYVKI